MLSFFNHLRALRKIKVQKTAAIIPSNKVRFYLKKNALILVNRGLFQLGFPLPGTPNVSTYSRTCISMDENSRLIIHGNLFLASGVSIRIGKNATVEFLGENFVAHNTLFLANKKITVGEKSGISWNCTFIDDDGHSFYRDNHKLRRFEKELSIGDNVGIQMNVLIPRGVTIGKNSIISAGSVLREDVPENTLVYSRQELVKKDGYSTGFERS